jgi:PAS domain S-box-containing protein
VGASIQTSAKNQTLWQQEYRVKFDDGTVRWLSGNAQPETEADGTILWHGYISDITERKQAEDDLKESTERHRGLSEAAFDSIFFSEKGLCIEQNLMAEKIFGYTNEEAIGRYGTEWIIEADRKKVMDNMIAGYEEPYEVTAIRKDGTTFPCILSGRMMYYKGRNVRVTSLSDITQRKQAEEALIKAKGEAVKANIAKSEFLSRMSHELRTPMNSILGFAQLLEMAELNPKQKKGVNHILTSGKHLLKLIDEVLDISRIEAGKLILSPEKVQVGRIINEMLDSVQHLIASRHIKMEMNISSSDEQPIIADRQRLKQVLLNLLSNAVKYNKEGGTITISTSFLSQSDGSDAFVRISISDTGNGISEAGMAKIFTPFERIGAEKTQTEGTGLGLSVVKKLMDAMGGNLGVESTPGVGSTFWIELPIAGNAKSHKQLRDENIKLTADLGVANTEIGFQNEEKGKRADELKVANIELAFQNEEKTKRADELIDAKSEIDFLTGQNREQATKLDNANKELSFFIIPSSIPNTTQLAKTGTILYIEDNESNIELIQQILADQRPYIQLLSNFTGKETVRMAIDCAAELILLDLDLPDINGNEVLEKLKADLHTKSIPVIIISADAMPYQVEQLMKAGAAAYLTKPFDVVQFLTTIDQFIKI